MQSSFSYVKKYLRENKYYDLENEILTQLESHPDYPSLYAIVDTLNYFGIENIAAKVDKEEFDNLPSTFISVYQSDTGNEIVYTRKQKEKVEIQFSNNYKKIVSTQEYKENWNSMVVAIEEKPEATNISTYFQNKTSPIVFVSVVAFSVTLSVIKSDGILYLLHLFVSLLGLIISFFLVREDLGINDAFISKICNASEKTSCKDVTSSKGAEIIKGVGLSDVSLIYFLVFSFLNLFSDYNSNILIYQVLSAFSIFVIFYSVYYQALKLRKWCVLCLGIVGVLLLEILINILNFKGFNQFKINYSSVLSFYNYILLFSFISIGWMELKKLLKVKSEKNKLEISYNKFKRKFSVFESNLNQSEKINESTLKTLPCITFGKPDAMLSIYVALSSSCGHCHTMFQRLINLTAKFPTEINFKLICNINIENKENSYNQVYKTLMKYHLEEKHDELYSAIKDWHINKLDLDTWTEKWDFNNSILNREAEEIIKQHYNWCLENNIYYTPSTILKDHIFPREYEVEDLHYFVENLK